ncbi:MAG: M23 family metallopeptidase [Clostridia bacterium]|nr:M23 family metallopeptidase [Clostridia bacterium]
MPEEDEILKTTNADFPRRKKKDTEKKDFFTHIIAVQIVVVTLLISGVFAVKNFYPQNFELLKASYTYIMSKDMTVREVFSGIKNFAFSQQGGDDISVFTPQSGTSFSPYFISTEICVPVSGSISSPFGYRINPVTKAFSFHSGVDIAADSGEKIKAAYYGKVTKVDYDDTSGNYIELTHEDGLVTRYLHCSKIIAEENMVVRSGETIALVGSTGRSTGPHLHFVIEIDGKKVDPLYVMEVNDNRV